MPQQTQEEKLFGAIRRGEECDLSNGQKHIRHSEMAGWGADRTVPADVLGQVLRGEHPATPRSSEARFEVRGAAVTGTLDLTGQSMPPIRLQWCRFDDVCFENATFSGDVSFEGSSFTGDAVFRNAVFDGHARFKDSSFAKGADFDHAKFARWADFENATFSGIAWFKGSTFAHTAYMSEGNDKNVPIVASFPEATFADDAWFEDATFVGAAWFDRAAFATTAWFKRARCTASVSFQEASFTGGTANFGGPMWLRTPRVRAAEFTGALARTWNLKAAKFHTLDPGPWIGETVILDSAVLFARSSVRIAATNKLSARWMQAREGAHLVINSPRVDLADAEFLRPSIIAGAAAATEMAQQTKSTGFLSAVVAAVSTPAATPMTSAAEQRVAQLEKDLREEFRVEHTPRCGVQSLARVNVDALSISGASLEECAFLDAHGLDKLRISEDCEYGRPPAWSRETPWSWPWHTPRRVIAEEARWRGWVSASGDAAAPPTSALAIAGIYRELRKGLEDAKNEPGAADFYYGEMEMRRLSGRKTANRAARQWPDETNSSNMRPAEPAVKHDAQPAPLFERALLQAYWAVSGYGLRASRALIIFALVVFSAAILFTNGTFAVVTDTATAPQFHEALEFTARESIPLLQLRQPKLHVQGPGTALDFLVRLSGPVLLGLFVLAIRGRIKR
jgi:uncharacterized protein YjbI with pentapeptide repeats